MWQLSIFSSFFTAIVTIIGAFFIVPKIRIKQRSDAGDMCRIMVANHRNYARHGLANARALINKAELSRSQLQMLLIRQKFDSSLFDSRKNDIEMLFPADIVSMIGHFFLLMRNINETSNFLVSFEEGTLEMAQLELFARNIRIAKLSHFTADFFYRIQNSYFPSPKHVEAKQENENILPDNGISLRSIFLAMKQSLKNYIFVLVYQNTQISFHELEKTEIGDVNTIYFEDVEFLCRQYNYERKEKSS